MHTWTAAILLNEEHELVGRTCTLHARNVPERTMSNQQTLNSPFRRSRSAFVPRRTLFFGSLSETSDLATGAVHPDARHGNPREHNSLKARPLSSRAKRPLSRFSTFRQSKPVHPLQVACSLTALNVQPDCGDALSFLPLINMDIFVERPRHSIVQYIVSSIKIDAVVFG